MSRFSLFEHQLVRTDRGSSDRDARDDGRIRALVQASRAEARMKISYENAVKAKVLPLGFVGNGESRVIVVATVHGRADGELQFLFQMRVQVICCDEAQLLQALYIAYKGAEDGLVAKLTQLAPRRDSPTRQIPTITEGSSLSATFLSSLIEYAIAQNVSDIHIIPRDEGSMIVLRKDGELLTHEQPLYSPKQHEEVVRRIKVVCLLDSSVQFIPQDGAFSVPTPYARIKIRVSTMPTLFGERVVLRVLNPLAVVALAELETSPRFRLSLERLLERTNGLVLLSGPTGSGKTTLLYLLAKELAARGRQITTIEDPIELELPFASQTQIQEKQGLTFARALRSTLRQDPDVIVVGELRDAESGRIAVEAALTGHLVMSSIHGSTIGDVAERLQQWGIEPSLLEQTIAFVASLRRIRKRCELCGDTVGDPVQGCTHPHGQITLAESLLIRNRFTLPLKDYDQYGDYESLDDATDWAIQEGVIARKSQER